jgi:hypothetical protein
VGATAYIPVDVVEGIIRRWKETAERWRRISPTDPPAGALAFCAKEMEQAISPFLEEADAAPTEIEVPAPKQCQVYVIRRPDSAEVKIGISADPVERLRQLQSSHSDKLELVASFAGKAVDERRLHERFKEYRKRGEWFRESSEISRWIEGLR